MINDNESFSALLLLSSLEGSFYGATLCFLLCFFRFVDPHYKCGLGLHDGDAAVPPRQCFFVHTCSMTNVLADMSSLDF